MFDNSRLGQSLFSVLLLVSLLAVGCLAESVSVRDFGAVGDGQADDTAAFVAAAKAGLDIYVPAGTYLVRSFNLPENCYFHGAGPASIIKFQHKQTGTYAVGIASHSRVSQLCFTATEPYIDWRHPSGSSTGLIRILHANDVSLDQLTFDNYRHMGVWITESENVDITNCRFEKLDVATLIEFSQRINVIGNRVNDIAHHGIMFWGNWRFERMASEDIIIANNYVHKGGDGAIWGCGARRVLMSGNVVNEARDLCLDLEWCTDSAITGNTVRGGWNAGIGLFYSCENVSVTGNTVVIVDGDEGRRDGIWLTPTNTNAFPNDSGHRTISITGNTIVAEGPARHGINIGSGSDITCVGNVLQNCDIFDCTGNVRILGESNMPATGSSTLADYVTIQPLSQEWLFQIDPQDIGKTNQWFSSEFDTTGWATVRSDQDGNGWETQGFDGDDGRGYTGIAWYRAELPTLPRPRRTFVYLHFGMVDEQAWVYLNGVKIGERSVKSEQRSIMAIWAEPFCVDISDHLSTDGPNVLTVRVQNDALNGGIRKPVYVVWGDWPMALSTQIGAINTLAGTP